MPFKFVVAVALVEAMGCVGQASAVCKEAVCDEDEVVVGCVRVLGEGVVPKNGPPCHMRKRWGH